MDSPFLATRRAFDSVAADYDGPLGNNPLVQKMRTRVMETIEKTFPPGARLLDLGCGTGIDAAYLGTRGYSIVAIDDSSAMVTRARERVRRVDADVRVVHLGMQDLERLDVDGFDGAYSNMGALNCLPDLSPLSRVLGTKIKPGGHLVAAVIGRYCPWEFIFYLMRGQTGRAGVRFSQGTVPVPLNGERVWMRYLAPREFARELAAEFEPVHQQALALFGPPPYLAHNYDRFRILFDWLGRADRALGDKPIFRNGGDHFLMVLKNK